MVALENPPGFIVRTEAQKAAFDNGYRLERGISDGWLHYASTTAQGGIWIAGSSATGPWLLSSDHPSLSAEMADMPTSQTAGPGIVTFLFDTIGQLHVALDRIYRLRPANRTPCAKGDTGCRRPLRDYLEEHEQTDCDRCAVGADRAASAARPSETEGWSPAR
ncbi:MAG TPA: hypothetical protein VK558_18285 [Patescibacteria group bacterium]|nr:hypothetical protein [Patescibacteria group bacterium]